MPLSKWPSAFYHGIIDVWVSALPTLPLQVLSSKHTKFIIPNPDYPSFWKYWIDVLGFKKSQLITAEDLGAHPTRFNKLWIPSGFVCVHPNPARLNWLRNYILAKHNLTPFVMKGV
jgi:hypothetical protein